MTQHARKQEHTAIEELRLQTRCLPSLNPMFLPLPHSNYSHCERVKKVYKQCKRTDNPKLIFILLWNTPGIFSYLFIFIITFKLLLNEFALPYCVFNPTPKLRTKRVAQNQTDMHCKDSRTFKTYHS